jgi:hypothetical protein
MERAMRPQAALFCASNGVSHTNIDAQLTLLRNKVVRYRSVVASSPPSTLPASSSTSVLFPSPPSTSHKVIDISASPKRTAAKKV